jgi:hypothetical protein
VNEWMGALCGLHLIRTTVPRRGEGGASPTGVWFE